MSTCIQFCGKPKRKNRKPEGEFKSMKPEVAVMNKEEDSQLRNKDVLNRLRYVEVKVNDEQFQQPPRGIDINIDM